MSLLTFSPIQLSHKPFINIKPRLIAAIGLLLVGSFATAAPSVSDNTISWPDDGWYQVQDQVTYTEVCAGGRFCDVEPGTYVVINHSTGERFNDITVVGDDDHTDEVTVTGNTISWPDDGWYQVQDQATHTEVCGGGRSCDVEPGTYVVINHSTGERFNDITVVGDDGSVSSGSTPDDMFQNRTQVDFVITVPVYQSSALQVRLNWGEIDITASWVGDELWSASAELPTDTEHTLNVTFYDNNGALELAGFEQAYRTGNNDFETYTIATEQFNSQLFDADEDGENNLDELIAGTNPLVNEAAELEVRDSYSVESIQRVSAYYEQTISNERPYSYRVEELPPADAGFDTVRRTHIVTIDIDDLGNGTVSDNYEYRDTNDSDITTEEQEGTRNKIEDSVLWVGTYRRSNSGSLVIETIDFSSETSAIDGQTRQTGTIQRELSGRGRLDFEQELSYSLIGEVLDDSPYCTPSSGTLTNRITNTRSFPVSGYITVASKESDDTLWSVRVTNLEGEFIEGYLAQSLTANFYCEFTDL